MPVLGSILQSLTLPNQLSNTQTQANMNIFLCSLTVLILHSCLIWIPDIQTPPFCGWLLNLSSLFLWSKASTPSVSAPLASQTQHTKLNSPVTSSSPSCPCFLFPAHLLSPDQDLGVIFDILPGPHIQPPYLILLLSSFSFISQSVFVSTSILVKTLWLPERNEQSTWGDY